MFLCDAYRQHYNMAKGEDITMLHGISITSGYDKDKGDHDVVCNEICITLRLNR